MLAAPRGVTLEAETRFGRALTARRWRLANGLGVIAVVDRSALGTYASHHFVASRQAHNIARKGA